MALSKTQEGRVGELFVTVLAMLTSDGELEVFRPETDDDHVDLTVARKGGDPKLAIQVKTALRLNPAGFVHATGYLVDGGARSGPGFLYAVVWVDGLSARLVWLVPGDDFNRLVYRSGDQLIFEAYPDRDDRWAGYRSEPERLGPALLEAIGRVPAGFTLRAGGLRPDRGRGR